MRNKTSSWSAALLTVAAGCSIVLAVAQNEKEANNEAMEATSIYDFTVEDIDGQEVKLADYLGAVCLIINVASL